ncbi:MAG: DUF4115 domain-containing protein [Endomicrobiaceae bacterium]|jgi:cytoskeletal protein RodZ|nr:DUF4115 domain-containing protein [Endomicrobiaceae bacterium]
MNEIGKILKQARKKKRYSLEKIRKMTKIKESYIIGLENSDIDAFPAEIYYKNFLKSYSKCLGLNPDEILKMYEENKLINQDDLFKHHDNSDEKNISDMSSGGRLRLAITAVSAAAMFVFLFMYGNVLSNGINGNFSCGGQTAVGKQADEVKAVAQLQTSTSAVTATATQTAVAVSSSPSVQQAAAAPKTKKTLLVSAVKNTWVKITADNKKIYEETLYAGKQYKAVAYDNFEVKIGNVDGVELYYNDKRIDISAGASQNKVNTITLK